MNNKIIKKYHLIKLFMLCLPNRNKIRKTNFFLCKYIAKKTPYLNIDKCLKEFYKLFFLQKNLKFKKNIIFSCSHKMYSKFIKNDKKQSILKKRDLHEIINNNYSFFVLCNNNFNSKQISLIKHKKIPIIGFIDLKNIIKFADYVILIENKFFVSFFFFNYIIKKLTTL